ncbi:MAG TPA: hypothetical protein PLJ18_12010 [Niabella sp.]|nr:hypothetical protein [Niabella sp.]
MQKQPQHFYIDDYYMTKAGIVVEVTKSGIMIPVTIPELEFEWFLQMNEKLNWEYSHTDGIHGTGKMTMEEYWATDKAEIHADLYSFITTHPIKNKGTVWTDSTKSLSLAFDLHLAKKRNVIKCPDLEPENGAFCD